MKTLSFLSLLLAAFTSTARADCTVTTWKGEMNYYNGDKEPDYKAIYCRDNTLEVRRQDINEPMPGRGGRDTGRVFDQKIDLTLIMNCQGIPAFEEKMSMKLIGNDIWTERWSDLRDEKYWSTQGEKAYFGTDKSLQSLVYHFGFEDHSHDFIVTGMDGAVYVTQELHSDPWGKDYVRTGKLKLEGQRICQ